MVSNLIGQIWAAAMMLDHLGEVAASASFMRAIGATLADQRLRIRDLGGPLSTDACGKAVAERVE